MALIDTLVAYWSLDEASGDAIDAHSTFDLSDTATVGAGTGIISGARDFEASLMEYFTIGGIGVYRTLPMSINMWVKPESLSVDMNVLSGGVADSNARAWGVSVNQADDTFSFYASNDSSSFIGIDSTQTLTVGVWSMLTLVWRSATDYQIYFNGESAATGSTSRSPSGSQSRFRMGAYHSGAGDFDGLIDEVGWWSSDISASLATLYNGGAGLAYPLTEAGTKARPPLRRRRSFVIMR